MEQKLATIIGTSARSARQRLELTQADVAARVGIATEVYGRLERGHMLPSVRTLRKLCLVLNVSPDRLLGLTGNPVLSEEYYPKRSNDTNVVNAVGLYDKDVRRLLCTLRKLEPKQLHLLGQVARAIFAGPSKR